MPEGVVVGLEAVEVEHHQEAHRAGPRRPRRQRPEVLHQAAAIGEPGQRVGERLVHALPQVQLGFAEGERHPRHHRQQGRQRQHRGAGRDREVAVGEEDADRRQRRERRHQGDPEPSRAAAPAHGGRQPGSGGEQQDAERPGGVEQAVFDVGALGGLQQVDDVGAGEDDKPEPERQPAQPRAPATEGGDGDDQREQRQVGDRVGEVGRRRGGVAAGRGGDDRPQGQRARQGGDGAGGDQAVEPAHRREGAELIADQGDQPRVGDRVEGEIAGVGRGGDRQFAAPGDRGRVIDFSGRVGDQRRPEQGPAEPFAPDHQRPHQARRCRAQHQRVIEPGAEQFLIAAAEPHRDVQQVGEEAEYQQAAAEADEQAGVIAEVRGHHSIHRTSTART